MRALALVVAVCAIAAAVVSALPEQKTLVLLDSAQYRNTHSIFFKSLADRGHKLTFSVAGSDDDVILTKYGDFFFDNLILFAPTAEDLGGLAADSGVVKFVDSGRNVLVAVTGNVSEPIREIANDCGVDFDEADSFVIDHANFDAVLDTAAEGDHTVVAATNLLKAPAVLGAEKAIAAPVLFRGVGQAATSSPLLYCVLSGSSASYSHKPSARVKAHPQSAGADVLLVSAVQTRNNARVVFSGSIELFSNKFFMSGVNAGGKVHAKSGNEAFSFEITQWLFQRRGLLRASPFRHSQHGVEDAPLNPQSYRVKDDVNFEVTIEEVDTVTGGWKPFAAPAPVQFEAVMIDPYIRTPLNGDRATGKFSARVTLPDVYGVYKFVVRVNQIGYGNLLLEEQVSIHPFRHDQFERFIDVAYPYYASTLSMMVGFFLFGFVFLYSNPSAPTTTAAETKKSQ